ncbi:putative serpin-ZX-like protein [Tanacetum coccineum]
MGRGVSDWRSACALMADGSSNGGPCLSFANGVWVEKTLSLKPSFKQVLETLYNAASNQVDFQNKAHQQTNGLIKEILPAGAVDVLPGSSLQMQSILREPGMRSVVLPFTEGTEATAVTTSVIQGFSARMPDVKVDFVADHPFLFVIKEDISGVVNEEGTEAAAVTAGVFMLTSLRRPDVKVDFVADHPFFFVIREDISGVVLFMGQVIDPQIA